MNYKTAEIPEQYNGKPVVSLRGNTFSDMPLLESIKLPDTIKEIRGQAFKNCISLTNINIPKNLEYLG
ncbi:MAG: leucine-rich repeat domain-containing protein [Patescibacteria group bacterium]|nr:leucine-rich repeat domain-containing protein [Patescibacteria group bacterium]